MTKGYVDAFLEICQGILLDALTLDPRLREGFDRDVSRLRALASQHGVALFTLHFPAIGKVIDQALDSECLPLIALPMCRRINTRTVIPRLFQGIWLHVFDHEGSLRQDIDPTWVQLLRQLYYVGKSLNLSCAPKAVYETVKEFYDVESEIIPPSPIWASDGGSLSRGDAGHLCDLQRPEPDDLFAGETPQHDVTLLDGIQRIADIVVSELGEYFPSESRFRHGPGATSEFPRGKSYKYDFPAWGPRLEHHYPYEEFGLPNASILVQRDGSFDMPPRIEGASRLIAVPKTADRKSVV